MNNGTPLSDKADEIPGWYINFQAAILKQLPRPGQIDQVTADSWEKDSKSLKEALYETLEFPPGKEINKKFELLNESYIQVPKDYVHATQIAFVYRKYPGLFAEVPGELTDQNCAKVTDRLSPGARYRVRIFGIKPGFTLGFDECLKKYKAEEALLVGAQGLTLFWEQFQAQLCFNVYLSFDKLDRLPVVTHAQLRVIPSILRSTPTTGQISSLSPLIDFTKEVHLVCFKKVE